MLERGELAARLRAAGCVFAEDEAELLLDAARSQAELERMVSRRVAGEPLELVVGWVTFCELRVRVDGGVFVPRPRTEALALAAVDATRDGSVVVDLCCGAGAIAAVVHERAAGAVVHAADVDANAVRCARSNLAWRGVQVHEGDLFDALPGDLRGCVDVLVANVPYVPSEDVATLPREARDHEPLLALDGGADGLDMLRRVASGAHDWLAPDGVVLCEVSCAQAAAARGAFEQANLESGTIIDDDLDVVVVHGRAAR